VFSLPFPPWSQTLFFFPLHPSFFLDFLHCSCSRARVFLHFFSFEMSGICFWPRRPLLFFPMAKGFRLFQNLWSWLWFPGCALFISQLRVDPSPHPCSCHHRLSKVCDLNFFPPNFAGARPAFSQACRLLLFGPADREAAPSADGRGIPTPSFFLHPEAQISPMYVFPACFVMISYFPVDSLAHGRRKKGFSPVPSPWTWGDVAASFVGGAFSSDIRKSFPPPRLRIGHFFLFFLSQHLLLAGPTPIRFLPF